MALLKKRKAPSLIQQIRRLKAENAALRAKLEEKDPDWKELHSVSLTTEERNALLSRSSS